MNTPLFYIESDKEPIQFYIFSISQTACWEHIKVKKTKSFYKTLPSVKKWLRLFNDTHIDEIDLVDGEASS